jgi:hypothetical protein
MATGAGEGAGAFGAAMTGAAGGACTLDSTRSHGSMAFAGVHAEVCQHSPVLLVTTVPGEV